MPREEAPVTPFTPVTPVTWARLAAVGAVVVITPLVLFPLIGRWTLLWVPLVLMAVTAVLLRTRAHAQARERTAASGASAGEPGHEPDGRSASAEHPPVPAGTGRRIRPVALPSAVADYDLVFAGVVHWRWNGHVDLRLRDPVAPAVHAVVTRAAELVSGTEPGDHGLAECDLAARLAVETAVTGAGIVVWAEDVELRLPDEDAERLRSLAGLRKDRDVRDAVRAIEAERFGAAARTPRARRDAVSPAREVLEDGVVVRGPHVVGERLAARGPHDADDLHDLDDLDELDDLDHLDEAGGLDGPGPGNDVDGEGFESYWWPAETPGHDAAERDVQVAIIRGLIDSVEAGAPRLEFARAQLDVLEQGGFDEVARRIREVVPELSDGSSRGTAP
ncbi:hypothetical protein DFP74_6049 [Nocardiopsis sp. Huas11]|uniref:hypothetical protein n=1 Tax=Nocardiopsis sp. Huas11 TaxID=2183912 RepID=UPI000EAD2A1B|nr:hypothetical protein [Nocardiopsis sp. Huas11]RKS10286.1 hypothetical protein DFP74_6049 [Nocardiopsis sp. Huas11]